MTDRSCVVCHDTFAGVVVHCCPRCWHPVAAHTPGLRCRTCGNECGIDCRPSGAKQQWERDRWSYGRRVMSATELTSRSRQGVLPFGEGA